MDGIKITEQDCRDILKDEPENVYSNQLGKLYNNLALSNNVPDMYRLQGAISLLQHIMELKEKARKQLEN